MSTEGNAVTDPMLDANPVETPAADPVADPVLKTEESAEGGLLTEPEHTLEEGEGLLTGKQETGGAPEAYTAFDIPEGVEAEPHVLKAVEEVAREMNMSQEAGQEFVNAMAAYANKQQQMLGDQTKAWGEEVRNDPDLGGVNMNKTIANGKKALSKFGDTELTNFLRSTGLENFKPLLRVFAKVGAALDEPSTIKGPVKTPEVDILAARFPGVED